MQPAQASSSLSPRVGIIVWQIEMPLIPIYFVILDSLGFGSVSSSEFKPGTVH